MARACSRDGLAGAALCERAGGAVDAVDADQVCAQVRDEQEVARRVGEDMVRVGGFLAAWVGANAVHLVFDGLKGLGAGEGKLEGRDLAGLAAARVSLYEVEGEKDILMRVRDE